MPPKPLASLTDEVHRKWQDLQTECQRLGVSHVEYAYFMQNELEMLASRLADSKKYLTRVYETDMNETLYPEVYS